MGPRVSYLLSCIFLLFLLVPLLPLANSSSSKDEKSSPFGSIKHFKGCKKGDNIKGIQNIKKYFEKYGYLSYHHSKGDYFDDNLESAIKTYQLNYDLNITGTLDPNTLSLMAMPRCGVPDIINGTNLMALGKKLRRHALGTLHVHTYYEIGNTKWPTYKLSWALKPGTRDDARGSVAQALSKWASVSPFKFGNSKDFAHADLKISFERLDHGDNAPFDGPGGVLAHAYMPPNGNLHFDADETWAAGAAPGAMDIGTVGLHEIGHLLGLGHSSLPQAIMYPYIGCCSTKGLNKDDIDGMKALYHY